MSKLPLSHVTNIRKLSDSYSKNANASFIRKNGNIIRMSSRVSGKQINRFDLTSAVSI